MADFNELDVSEEHLYVSNDSDSNWDIYELDGDVSISTSTSDNDFNVKGSIQVDDTGTVSYNQPDPEKIEKRKKVSKNQLNKVQRLIDSIIESIAQSDLSREMVERCKSDLRVIREMERMLKNGVDKAETFDWNWNSKAILDPDQLETLNEIHRRWT